MIGIMDASTESTELKVLSCMGGYHVYKDRWAAAVGELLMCFREPINASVQYTVAMIKEGATIGHLLNTKISVGKNFVPK